MLFDDGEVQMRVSVDDYGVLPFISWMSLLHFLFALLNADLVLSFSPKYLWMDFSQLSERHQSFDKGLAGR
jgi:hypothetical protein